MNKTYLFGILPALIGAVIFILWYVTNVEYFILAGMLFLYIGGASVVVGIISSFIQLIKYKNFKTFSIGLGLNLSNIPLAFILASSAISIITAYTVKFENSGSSIVKELHLTGPNINIQINSLEVGRKAKSILHFKGDGTLILTYKKNGVSHQEIIEGYVTNGMGGHAKVVFFNSSANILHNAEAL